MIRTMAMIPFKTARYFILSVPARLRADMRGTAAIEFALILPLMLSLFIGTVEFYSAIAIDRKVTLMARTLSDLVSQGTKTTNLDMANFFAMGPAMLTPYATSPMKLRVSAIDIDANGVAKVAWSDGSNMAPLTTGIVVTVPAGLRINNTQLIFSEVTYRYTPILKYVLRTDINLADEFYTRPRQSSTVTRSPT
jgi:Flp pilus assembly protein TadG